MFQQWQASTRTRVWRCILLMLVPVLGGVAAAGTGYAQQFETDDATLTNFRACQLEAWYGELEMRIEPACHLLRNLGVTLGLGFDPQTRGVDEYTLELKTRFRELSPGGFGVGLVVGLDVHGRADAGEDRLAGAFAYVPASLSFGDDRFLLHANLGWHLERNGHDHGHAHDDEGEHHALTWAVRGDLHLPWLDERFAVVGEVFSEDWLRPGFQAGLRTSVVPERLILDLSWGGHTDPLVQGNGWIVGVGWTPRPLF